MSRLRILLRRIARGIKESMTALYFGAGGILIPLSFYLKIETDMPVWYSGVALILGILFWGLAIRTAQNEDKKNNVSSERFSSVSVDTTA